MVSCFHYYSVDWGKEINFSNMIRDDNIPFDKWHKHVESWLSNPYHAQMIVIKYEDLIKNTVDELKRFCKFIGIQRSDSVLESIVKQSSFKKLRQKEIDYSLNNPEWPRDKMFFRRGEVGTYRDEMPPDVLKEFLVDAKDTLRKLGYL